MSGYSQESRRRYYNKLRSAGRCPYHPRRKAQGGWAYCRECRKNQCEAVLENQRKLKGEVILAYGGQCACCRENYLPFLTIDHVKACRGKRDQGYGSALYRWLKREGYPRGFQVLCMNCNWHKRDKLMCLCPYRVKLKGG
jgi:hypothetical protein